MAALRARHGRWKSWEGFHAFPRSGSGGQQGAGGIAAVLCNAGKNACDDNNSVQNNVVVNN